MCESQQRDKGKCTSPVESSRGSKNQIMTDEGSRHALLAVSKLFMASVSAVTEVPVSTILICIWVDGQILTQDVTAANDGVKLVGMADCGPPLIAMSARLK